MLTRACSNLSACIIFNEKIFQYTTFCVKNSQIIFNWLYTNDPMLVFASISTSRCFSHDLADNDCDDIRGIFQADFFFKFQSKLCTQSTFWEFLGIFPAKMSYLLKPYFLNSYTIQIFYTEESANTSIMPTSHEKVKKKINNRNILTCATCMHGHTKLKWLDSNMNKSL